MNDLVQLLHVIPATEVAKRWNVITGERLNEIVKKYRLPLYSVCEKRIRPDDGKTIYFCHGPYFKFYYEGDYGYGEYILKGMYFDADRVTVFEFEHPEILWKPDTYGNLEEEYGEYIPADVVRKLLNMSPNQFINMMNSGKGPVSSWEEARICFEENLYSNGYFFSTRNLQEEGFTFHILDLKEWDKKRREEEQPTIFGVQSNSGNSEAMQSALRSKDAEISRLQQENAQENERFTARIAELETEIAAKDNELATCRKQLEEAREVTTSGIEGHGLCSQVIHMRQDGKTEEEIAATLYDNKQWCSIAQVGVLLHRGGRVTADSMLKYGQRLLGKA